MKKLLAIGLLIAGAYMPASFAVYPYPYPYYGPDVGFDNPHYRSDRSWRKYCERHPQRCERQKRRWERKRERYCDRHPWEARCRYWIQ